MVPLTIFPYSPPLVEGNLILHKPCDFVDPFFYVRVLVEVQFLGYKFGLKGSTYTQENTVYVMTIMATTVTQITCKWSSSWIFMISHFIHISFIISTSK